VTIRTAAFVLSHSFASVIGMEYSLRKFRGTSMSYQHLLSLGLSVDLL